MVCIVEAATEPGVPADELTGEVDDEVSEGLAESGIPVDAAEAGVPIEVTEAGIPVDVTGREDDKAGVPEVTTTE